MEFDDALTQLSEVETTIPDMPIYPFLLERNQRAVFGQSLDEAEEYKKALNSFCALPAEPPPTKGTKSERSPFRIPRESSFWGFADTQLRTPQVIIDRGESVRPISDRTAIALVTLLIVAGVGSMLHASGSLTNTVVNMFVGAMLFVSGSVASSLLK